MNDQSHLKNPLPPVDVPLPKDCTLVSDPNRSRLTDEQCAMTVNCLIRDDGPRNLTLLHTTGLKGEPGNEWVECSSSWGGGVYRWVFFVRGGYVSNCFLCTTPKMSEYNINIDRGSPFDDVSIEDRTKLTHLLITSVNKKTGVEVVPCWILAINGARPSASKLFYDHNEAEEAATLLRASLGQTEASQKEAQSTEKAISKDQTSIAYKSKKKGLKKIK